jgi:hypothetical protein
MHALQLNVSPMHYILSQNKIQDIKIMKTSHEYKQCVKIMCSVQYLGIP